MIKPVKRISQSDRDKNYLAQISPNRSIDQDGHPENYRTKVVIKPWGHEFLVFENECVAIWFLAINKDHSTSMHCHPGKRTSLTLLAGSALCVTFKNRSFLSAGDSLIIDASVFHSTKALSLDGISLLEVETPPDKLDLVRLEDKYGRESRGYENFSQMITEGLKDYDHFYFDESSCNGENYIFENRFVVSMEVHESAMEFKTSFTLDPSALYCVCRGSLLDNNGEVVVDLGETQRGNFLGTLKSLNIARKTTLMKITVFA
jgi:mannose-6-phosphate isomerase-like protein (cupin superfamily)